jgi:NAD+ synthase (glutamine-hydrolysing)
VRIALAQINSVVGDIAGNAVRITRAMHRAAGEGADLTVFPELVLTGYPPEDLLAKAHFVRTTSTRSRMSPRSAPGTALVGLRRRRRGALQRRRPRARSAVAHVYRKRLLPNYGVFDEERYFEPGTRPPHVHGRGRSGVAHRLRGRLDRRACRRGRTRRAGHVQPVGLAVPRRQRRRPRGDALRRAAENGVWLAFCNLVGGQDELVFDGRSALISPEGGRGARRGVRRGPAHRRHPRQAGGVLADDYPDPEEETYAALTPRLARLRGARTASPTWSSGSRAASTRRSPPRSPQTPSARRACTA